HEDALVIERSVLLGERVKLLPGAHVLTKPFRPADQAGTGCVADLSGKHNSMSGSAHWAKVKSPRSQAAKIERISSMFSRDTAYSSSPTALRADFQSP